MLLMPKLEEGRREPAALASGAVDEGVAGRTEGDQPGRVVDAGLSMVDGLRINSPAAPAGETVAGQHGFPETGKVADGVAPLSIAGPAEAGNGRLGAAEGAEGELGARKGHGPL